MADYLEMLRQLASVFAPREAEAKMMALDPAAGRLLQAQREAKTPAPGSPQAADALTGRWFSPERRKIYQDIGRATEAHPRIVGVEVPDKWPEEYANFAGLYDSRGIPSIRIAPRDYMANALPSQDVLAHEQLHFLMQQLIEEEKALPSIKGWPFLLSNEKGASQAYDSDELQHGVINYLLGAYTSPEVIKEGTYAKPMSSIHPPASSPEVADAYRRLIYQIFPEEQRRAKALAGLGAARGGTLLEELR